VYDDSAGRVAHCFRYDVKHFPAATETALVVDSTHRQDEDCHDAPGHNPRRDQQHGQHPYGPRRRLGFGIIVVLLVHGFSMTLRAGGNKRVCDDG
jgi:hypothetical protein